ncbi:MAG: TetR/AcrR family transcriptional regulator [Sulfitobacter sp.]
MARPREFKTDDAIEKAMQVFWIRGYEDASLPDLLVGMGLTRGSLYKAFGDKKSLYLNVLRLYEQVEVDAAVAMLTDEGDQDGAARIAAMFDGIAQGFAKGDRRGCLLCTAAAGVEMSDPDIAGLVKASLAKLRDGFEAALNVSATHRAFADDTKTDIANTLLTQYIGLRVLARADLSLDLIEAAGRQARLILSGR